MTRFRSLFLFLVIGCVCINPAKAAGASTDGTLCQEFGTKYGIRCSDGTSGRTANSYRYTTAALDQVFTPGSGDCFQTSHKGHAESRVASACTPGDPCEVQCVSDAAGVYLSRNYCTQAGFTMCDYSEAPTASPTTAPTSAPTASPTYSPTSAPSAAPTAVPTPGHCIDTTKTGDESDIDCGGSCPLCGTSKNCTASTDCASGYCKKENGTNTCDFPTLAPTASPTLAPTPVPTTGTPTKGPTLAPTAAPAPGGLVCQYNFQCGVASASTIATRDDPTGTTTFRDILPNGGKCVCRNSAGEVTDCKGGELYGNCECSVRGAIVAMHIIMRHHTGCSNFTFVTSRAAWLRV
jgi:hypothetical protein